MTRDQEAILALTADNKRLRGGLQLIADDTHRLMNEVARQTAASILGGKPVGAADQPNDATERTGIEFLHLWMRTPNPMLGNVSPLDMMDSGRGERLADFIRDAAEADGITIPALAKSLSETEAALERETALLTEAKRQNADLMAIIDKRDEALGFIPLDKGMDMQDELRETKTRLAEAVECCTIKDNRNLWLEIRLKKIMARCADLLDEDKFNELDAIARATDSADLATGDGK